jgi:hypothetical protein
LPRLLRGRLAVLPGAQQGPDRRLQLVRLERLGEPGDSVGDGIGASARYHQAPPGHVRGRRYHFAHEVCPQLLPEPYIGEHRLVRVRVERARVGDRGGNIDVVAARRQGAPHHGAHRVRVFDDQYPAGILTRHRR